MGSRVLKCVQRVGFLPEFQLVGVFQNQLGEKPLAVGQDQQQFGLDIRECPVAGEQEERLSGESREEVVEFAAEHLFGLAGQFRRKVLHFFLL